MIDETMEAWGKVKDKVAEIDWQLGLLQEKKADLLSLFTIAHSPVKPYDVVKVGVSGKVLRAQVLKATPTAPRSGVLTWEVALVILNRSDTPHVGYSSPVTKDLVLTPNGYEWSGGLVKELQIEKM